MESSSELKGNNSKGLAEKKVSRSILHTAIGLAQLVGAAWSAETMLALVRNNGGFISWPLLLFGLGGFVLVGLAGLTLLRGREVGEALTIVVQVPQLFQVTAGPLAFRFIAGPEVSVFWNQGFGWFLGLTSTANLWRGPADPPFVLGVNLFAVAVLTAIVLVDGDSKNALRP